MDLAEVAIRENSELRGSVAQIYHLALDIGGSLIKLVYFSKDGGCSVNDEVERSAKEALGTSTCNKKYPIFHGRIHFAKFETRKIDDCLDFIHSKQLLNGEHAGSMCHEAPANENIIVKSTGGGAYKFANLFKEKLGISFEKKDEMDCLVAGANFLLKTVHQEAFTYMDGRKEFVQIDQNDLYPYLLVNIGSGVSMIKVDGDGKFERISGTSVGGGTFWGLGKLLTKCKSFDDLLEMSHRGNNRTIDMLVGDIYGGMDYTKIGLSSTTIASSFGKAMSDNKGLEDYRPEDIARSLLRMISNNVGQIAYLNALRFGLKRIIFGGFFIRSHEYTMETISVAVNFWSKGEAKAMFLRHEGFLGAVGAFTSYEEYGVDKLVVHHFPQQSVVSASSNDGPLISELTDNESIECFVYAV